MKLSSEERQDLAYAKSLLENPGLAAKLTNAMAKPIEKGFNMLPKNWAKVVNFTSRKSLQKALEFSVLTLGKKEETRSSDFWHKAAVAATGATGGLFGLVSIPIELPVSTIFMLRSIADIARSEGENLDEIETKLNCLQVFALGGNSKNDDAAETGYYAVRLSFSKLISDAVKHVARSGASTRGAPILVKFISTVASRFGVVVSEKVAAMAIPAIGAFGGAMVNTIFIDHFQDMARGHFIIRRLERKYGIEFVYQQYLELS
ncbi:peptidase [candidate division KSB1 bacterium 4572_119]|nr:MAG: peptidase [candidate division KSB1 bacterium 4572_119]